MKVRSLKKIKSNFREFKKIKWEYILGLDNLEFAFEQKSNGGEQLGLLWWHQRYLSRVALVAFLMKIALKSAADSAKYGSERQVLGLIDLRNYLLN